MSEKFLSGHFDVLALPFFCAPVRYSSLRTRHDAASSVIKMSMGGSGSRTIMHLSDWCYGPLGNITYQM